MTPIYIGGNIEIDRVASPESIPIYLFLHLLVLHICNVQDSSILFSELKMKQKVGIEM